MEEWKSRPLVAVMVTLYEPSTDALVVRFATTCPPCGRDKVVLLSVAVRPGWGEAVSAMVPLYCRMLDIVMVDIRTDVAFSTRGEGFTIMEKSGPIMRIVPELDKALLVAVTVTL
jgi:hypothetical protein